MRKRRFLEATLTRAGLDPIPSTVDLHGSCSRLEVHLRVRGEKEEKKRSVIFLAATNDILSSTLLLEKDGGQKSRKKDKGWLKKKRGQTRNTGIHGVLHRLRIEEEDRKEHHHWARMTEAYPPNPNPNPQPQLEP
jgi:hypothetical protein